MSEEAEGAAKATRRGWRHLPWWGKAAWVMLGVCVFGMATSPNAATGVVGLTALVGVVASLTALRGASTPPTPAASTEQVGKAAMPGWGYVGWAMLLIAVMGTIAAAAMDSSVTTMRDKEPFSVPPLAITMGIAGFLLGVAGLIVRELKPREQSDS